MAEALEKYELVGRAGAGAFSTVLRCRHTASGRFVALKRIDGPAVGGQGLDAVLQEAAILRACAHKHVVELLEVYTSASSGASFLVCEFVERTLARELLLAARGLPLPRVKVITWQLLEALSHLHSKGVTHHDLKPANVLLTPGYTVKVCDFGAARCRHLPCPAEPGPEQAAATRWYRAPEALLGLAHEEPADVWSLGCIVAELVTGRPLFAGEDQLDQLCLIVAALGGLGVHQEALLKLLPAEQRAKLDEARTKGPKLESVPKLAACPELLALLRECLNPAPQLRPTAEQIMQSAFFTDLRRALEAGRTAAGPCGSELPASGSVPAPEMPISAAAQPAAAGVPAPPSVRRSNSCKASAATHGMAAGGIGVGIGAGIGGGIGIGGRPRASSNSGAEGPRPTPLSALTANIKGRTFDSEGALIDLMPKVEELLSKWEAADVKSLGPIALAARQGSPAPPAVQPLSMPAPPTLAGSGPVASSPMGAVSHVGPWGWGAPMQPQPFGSDAPATWTATPIAAAAFGVPVPVPHAPTPPPDAMMCDSPGPGLRAPTQGPMEISAPTPPPLHAVQPPEASNMVTPAAEVASAALASPPAAEAPGPYVPDAAPDPVPPMACAPISSLPAASAGDLPLQDRSGAVRLGLAPSVVRPLRAARRNLRDHSMQRLRPASTPSLAALPASCPAKQLAMLADSPMPDSVLTAEAAAAAPNRPSRLVAVRPGHRRSYSEGLGALAEADEALGSQPVSEDGVAPMTGLVSKRRKGQGRGFSSSRLSDIGTWLQQFSVPENEPLLTTDDFSAPLPVAPVAGDGGAAAQHGAGAGTGAHTRLSLDGSIDGTFSISHVTSMPRPIGGRLFADRGSLAAAGAPALCRSMSSDFIQSLTSDVEQYRLASASTAGLNMDLLHT